MIRSFIFIVGLFLTVTAKGAIVSVENGDFAKVSDDKPPGWDASGQWRVIDSGGVDGKSAVELTCDGAGKASSAVGADSGIAKPSVFTVYNTAPSTCAVEGHREVRW